MLDYLTQYAIQNVWCSPYQDLQAVIQLRRATPVGGRRSYFEYGRQRYGLPDSTRRYHIYSLGQTSPVRLNLPASQGSWVRVADLCKARDLLIDLYVDNGRQFPRSESWMFRTGDKTYLLAVPILTVLPALDTQHLFMRFYSNAYYQSQHRPNGEPGLDIQGGVVTSPAHGLALQQAYHLALDGPGHAYAFHNGVFVSDFIPGSYATGDVLEWVYDPSVKVVVDFSYNTLQSFTSTVDAVQKYLLHPPKAGVEQIRYCDDVDVFVINTVGNRDVGTYYHKNVASDHRMVTHNDYSLKVSTVDTLRQSFPAWTNTTAVRVRLHIRQGGYQRALIPEARSLNELYKLDDDEIVSALLGVNATLPEWRAAGLEASLYTAYMTTPTPEQDKNTVPPLLGYNAISKLTGTPFISVSGGTATVPYGYQTQGTAFEYDQYGKLLGFRAYTVVDTYVPFYPGCAAVEFYSGTGQHEQDYTFSTQIKYLNKQVGYRFYVSTMTEGVSDGDWVDVTGDSTKYVIASDGRVNWLINPIYQLGLVKGDSTFHAYTVSLTNTTLVYDFTLTRGPALPIEVLPGKLDLWLNGHSLVESVDYHVIEKRVMIVNKSFLNTDGTDQVVTVRGTGFCQTNLKRVPVFETGFVKYGTLSVNDYYNVRSDKAIRVVVGGRVYDPASLKYEEDLSAVTPPGVMNGQPYAIDQVLVPLRGLNDYDTFALRPAAVDFDTRLGNYLNARIDPPVWPGPPFIPERYSVVSPTVSRILADLESGVLVAPPPNASGQVVDEAVQPYKYLMAFDPCVIGFEEDFVVVLAHPRPTFIDVTADGYAFLERVIKTYLKDHVDLTPSVRIV